MVRVAVIELHNVIMCVLLYKMTRLGNVQEIIDGLQTWASVTMLGSYQLASIPCSQMLLTVPVMFLSAKTLFNLISKLDK